MATTLMTIWFSFLFSLFTYQFSEADILLVADKSVSFEEYQAKCRLEGYQCTFEYFRNQHLKDPTPKFDAFIDSIDTTSKAFNELSAKAIKSILESESISLEQVEMLARVLEQTELVANRLLIKEIQFLKSLIEAEKIAPDEDYYMVFKKPIAEKSLSNFKKSYLNIPVVKMAFNRSPEKFSLRSSQSIENQFLVQGECEKAKVPYINETSNWKIFTNENCGWSQSIKHAVSSVLKSAHKNRNWIYAGAIIVGAAVLSSKYELQFSF